MLCFNAHDEPIEFTLPPAEFGACWRTVVYTGPRDATPAGELRAAAKFTVDAHSAVVLQAAADAETRR